MNYFTRSLFIDFFRQSSSREGGYFENPGGEVFDNNEGIIILYEN